MKQHLLSLLVAAALLAAGCNSTNSDLVTEAVTPVPAGSFVRAWKTDLKTADDPIERIYRRGNFLIAYTKSSTAYVMTDAGEMKFIHEIATTGGILRPPVLLADKLIYPTATTLEIYSLTGKHLRTLGLPNSTHGPAYGVGETIYTSLDYPSGGRVGAVDLTRDFNIMKWELYTGAGVSAAPAAYEKEVFFGTEDGTVFAVDQNRLAIWPLLEGNIFKTYGRIAGDLKADDFGVYVSSGDSKLYCIDRLTGAVKWQYFAATPLDRGPSVTATSVYQFVPGRGIVCLDKTSGSYNRHPRWTAFDGRQFLAEDEKNAYLRRDDNLIVALDKLTGEIRFISGHVFDHYVTNEKDAMIYACTNDGRTVGIRPVLTPGHVGVLVMDTTTPQPVASR